MKYRPILSEKYDPIHESRLNKWATERQAVATYEFLRDSAKANAEISDERIKEATRQNAPQVWRSLAWLDAHRFIDRYYDEGPPFEIAIRGVPSRRGTIPTPDRSDQITTVRPVRSPRADAYDASPMLPPASRSGKYINVLDLLYRDTSHAMDQIALRCELDGVGLKTAMLELHAIRAIYIVSRELVLLLPLDVEWQKADSIAKEWMKENPNFAVQTKHVDEVRHLLRVFKEVGRLANYDFPLGPRETECAKSMVRSLEKPKLYRVAAWWIYGGHSMFNDKSPLNSQIEKYGPSILLLRKHYAAISEEYADVSGRWHDRILRAQLERRGNYSWVFEDPSGTSEMAITK